MDAHSPILSRWHSLERRLPLLVMGLVAVAVVVLAAGAYRAVERTLLAAAEARLRASARQISSLLAESASTRREALARTAAGVALRDFASEGDQARRTAALAELSAALEPETLAVELWSTAGELSLSASPPESPELAALGRRPPDGSPLGPIRVEGGVAFYDLAAPVAASAPGSRPAAWLVVRRRLSSARAADILSGLIGREARLLLGNAAGGAWTDLSGPVDPPVTDGEVGSSPATFETGGRRRLGVATEVPGSPWLLWVDLPREVVLRPARDFLRQLAMQAGLLLLGSAAVGYGLSRQVTRPVEQLIGAAEGLAGGDLDREVPVHRRDEVGRLARAFDRMRHQVAEAHRRLEFRVQERTEELRQALETLRETQEELVRQERLAILGQLASGVGHELRNPLAVMTNAVYYLDMVLDEPTPEVKEYLGILRHQIGLSERIVSDLLDFARIKPPQREALSLPELAEQQLERVEVPPQVEVRFDSPPDLPRALCDPMQVGQVILNLLTNAVQAMDQAGGTLTLRSRCVGGEAVELQVCDSGPGVAADLHEKIFEPLFTTKARGIGLGLAVSRSLAEANGGALTLAERSGPGAVFALRLPHAEAAGG